MHVSLLVQIPSEECSLVLLRTAAAAELAFKPILALVHEHEADPL